MSVKVDGICDTVPGSGCAYISKEVRISNVGSLDLAIDLRETEMCQTSANTKCMVRKRNVRKIHQ